MIISRNIADFVTFLHFFEDESSVKTTATNPIFNEFLYTLLLFQILRYFTGIIYDIQGIYRKIFG